MRLGTNPSTRQSSDYRPARVTVCVLVCVPDQLGYHRQRFDVVRLCLESIVKHTPADAFDLLVLDNGSCREVVEYLRGLSERKIIRYLMLLSENVGRINGSRLMFDTAPGELVAYCDDDVVFYPGWLDAHLRVLETFPRVGMVSGQPVHEQFRYGNQYLPGYLAEFPAIVATEGRFIPAEWDEDFIRSTGRTEDEVTDAARNAREIMLEYEGVSAYSTATHFQFVGPRATIREAFGSEWHERLMRGAIPVDERLDAMGFARLTTRERYVRHVGNVITSDFGDIAGMVGMSAGTASWEPPHSLLSRFARRRIPGAILTRLNAWSYALLNHRGESR